MSQQGLYNESFGSYSQIINANKTTISSGDTIEISQLISGYGKIDSAKIYFSSSSKSFLSDDNSKTFILSGFCRIPFEELTNNEKDSFCKDLNIDILTKDIYLKKANARLQWGGIKDYIEKNGRFLVSLTAQVETGNETINMFSDFDKGSKDRAPAILSEMVLNNKPPLKWNLQTSKKLKPGNYKLKFVFTYYNGDKYQNDTQTLDIKVLTWYEKNEWFYKYAAILTIIVSLFSGGIKIFDRFFAEETNPINKNELYLIEKSNEINGKLDSLTKNIKIVKDSISN